MKTIRIKIYKFEELSKEAKSNALAKFRSKGIETQYIYDDAHSTVKAFNSIFGLKEGYNSWLDCYTAHLEDDILNLSGLRLRKYILNNYFDTLFINKYLKSIVYDDYPNKNTPFNKKTSVIHSGKNTGKIFVSFYSCYKKEVGYNLTGVCYDYNILQPIYDFLDLRDLNEINSVTFESLLNDCFSNLKTALQTEEDHLYSDEGIEKEILANDYDFLKDGTQY